MAPDQRTDARVLVVDDDRTTRHVTRTVLAKAGFKVRVAKDGKEALERLRAARYDLMLLDVWMPRMDGLQVLDRVKRMKQRPRVIVLTSDDAPETLLGAIRQRAHQIVHKPVAPLALLSLVREVINAGPELPIDVLSARANWVELAVPCTRDAADRLRSVMGHLDANLPEDVRESIGYAFRELVLNAVEWGGKLDPKRKVRISYLRAKRMLLYRIADPGPGFKMEGLDHAAISHPDDPIEHMNVREQKGLRPGGFGILTVRANVDELIYNEKQNEVVFVKYLD
ncbi:MAG TPA: response regulator [Vicinamibacterales bacterium]|jgi:CheY-like chemotaxis protein/anti-sigma regulatory factor (Ser/Thr protein kinase)|nr:response regulator [Vicinamibacterales bacterium]